MLREPPPIWPALGLDEVPPPLLKLEFEELPLLRFEVPALGDALWRVLPDALVFPARLVFPVDGLVLAEGREPPRLVLYRLLTELSRTVLDLILLLL